MDTSSPNIISKRSTVSSSAYIAGRVNVSDVEDGSVEFTVGSGMSKENPPLDEEQVAYIYIGSCSVIDEVRIVNC